MNKSLKVLFTYNGVFVFASYLLGSLYAIFAENITKDVFLVSTTTFTLFLSTTIFTYLISKYGDRVKEREYLLLGGYLVRALTWFCFAFAKNIQAIIILQFFLGMGESLGNSAWSAMFAEHLDKNKAINEYATWHLISTTLGAVSTLIGGLIVKNFGFSVLFFTMSGFAIISFFGILLKPRKLL